MNLARDHLFPRAALSGDQYSGVAARDRRYLGTQGGDRGTLAAKLRRAELDTDDGRLCNGGANAPPAQITETFNLAATQGVRISYALNPST